MPRKILTNAHWKKLKPLLPPERGNPGRPYSSPHRVTIEGVLWIGRTRAPWRGLPERFGNWNTVNQRFRRWVRAGIFDRVFDALSRLFRLNTLSVEEHSSRSISTAQGLSAKVATRSRRGNSRRSAEAAVA